MFWNKNNKLKTVIGDKQVFSLPQKELKKLELDVYFSGHKTNTVYVTLSINESPITVTAKKELTFEPNPEYLENTLERINKRIAEELFAPNKEKVNINKILEEEIKILEEYSKYVVDGEEGIVSVSGN